MACSYVAASGLGFAVAAGGSPATVSYNSTGGDALWVAVSESGGSTVTGVTFNGIALTQKIGPVNEGGFFTSASVWVLTTAGGLAAGTFNIVITFSSGTHTLTGMAWLTTGTHQTTPCGTAITGTGSSPVSASGNLTSVSGDPNGLFFDVLVVNNETTAPTGFSGGNGQTQITGSPTANSVHNEVVVGQKAGAISTTLGGWTWTTAAHYTELGFGVNAAAGASSPIVIVQNVPVTAATLADATGTITGVAVGNTIAVMAAIWNTASGGVNTAPTVTDTTLSLALTAALAPTGTANGGANTNLQCGIWFLPSGSVTAGTHAIDLHSTCGNITHIDMAILEIAGITGSPLDVTASAIAAATLSITAGPTATTAQAVELALAVLAQRSSPGVANAAFACSGYTSLMRDSVTTDGLGALLCYQILNGIGTPSAAFSWADNGTVGSQAVIALLKSGAGGAVPSQRLTLLGVGS